ncbi:hypothetical protein DMUE_0252 [Dictyocoela muelleri]|nr:hypothetical protein DMUE_0252 [Dictyocoela muelleri]
MIFRINKMRDNEFFNIIQDDNNIMKLFETLGIILKDKTCQKCKRKMHKKEKKRERLRCVWYCRNCKLSRGIFIDSQIYNIRMKLKCYLSLHFISFRKSILNMKTLFVIVIFLKIHIIDC